MCETRECKYCKSVKDVVEFYPKNKSRCKICCIKHAQKRIKDTKVTMEEDEEKYFEQRVRAKYADAKLKNFFIDLTSKEVYDLFVKQGRTCALSGLPFEEANINYTASIDRIDSTKGYTIKNIQLILNCLNKGKGQLGQNDFIKTCLSVATRYHLNRGYRVELVEL